MIRGLIRGTVGSGGGGGGVEVLPTPLKTFDFSDGTGQVDPDITFARSGTKLYWDSTGALATAADGVCPTQYSPKTLKPLGILCEGAATNLCTYASDLTNAAWSKTDITITADVANGPDGTASVDRVTEGSAGTALLSRSFSTTANTVYTASRFLTYSNTPWVVITHWDGTGGVRMWVNLRTKKVGRIVQVGTGSSYRAAGIEDCGAFGVRVWTTCRCPGTTITWTLSSASADGSTTPVSGAGYGHSSGQFETGTIATTYIPTTTTTATRNAETFSFGSLTSKSWWVGNGGVCVVDCVNIKNSAGPSADTTLFYAELDGSNYFTLRRGDQYYGGRWNAFSVNGGTGQADIISGVANTGINILNRPMRIALGWKNNNLRLGVQDCISIEKDTSCTIPAVTAMYVGSNFYIKKIRFYGDLSDDELKLVLKGQEQQFFGREQLIHHGTIIPKKVTNSDNIVQFQTMFELRNVVNASKIKLVSANYTAGPSSGLVNGPSAFTRKASIKWGGTYSEDMNHVQQVKWDGSTSVTIQPGDVIESDALDLNLYKWVSGQRAWVTILDTYSAAPESYNGSFHFLGNGSGNSESSTTGTLTDRTMTGGWAAIGINNVVNAPIGVLGQAEIATPVIAILGDSISCAGTEYGILGYDYGWAQMGLTGAGLPWVNCGTEGKPRLLWVNSQAALDEHERVLDLMMQYGVTHALDCLGINDMAYGGETTASMLENLDRLKVLCNLRGIELIPTTLPPKTKAGNSAELDESVAKRSGYNTAVRAMSKYFDVALYSEDGSTGLWRTDLGTPTNDGIHPTAVIHKAIRDAFIAAAPTLFNVVTP